MRERKPYRYVASALSLLFYIAIAYGIERQETLPLFACYFAVFLLYMHITMKHKAIEERELKFWIGAAVIFRASLLFAIPALSDDFYRFVWDGRLLAAGYHPFAEVPSYYMSQPVSIPGIDAALYNRLNATETFTVYPPVAQFIFWLSVKLSPESLYGSVIVMRVIILSFEIATLWMLSKILRQFKQPQTAVLLYALNPLVILELTGNVHHEGIMIFFLLAGIWFLNAGKKRVLSSLAYAFSICTKLVPLLFLPLLVRYLGWKKAVLHWMLTMVFTVVLFLPLLNMEIVYGLSTGLGYYFQRFEFNASIYYLVREAGFLIAGFNIISYAGPFLALVAAVLILYISFRNLPATNSGTVDSKLFKEMLWCLFIYFLSTTILHPWYIITLLPIGIMTPYRFPMVWTGAIFLTYAGYTETAFIEKPALVALEYTIVIAYLIYETIWKRQRNHS
jgi:alpha-1,6-mannosyltransferase